MKILALTIRLLAAAPLLLLAALLPGPSLAQTLEGSLTDRESGLPVDGALVLLMDGEGQELLGRIPDEEGLFRLVARAPRKPHPPSHDGGFGFPAGLWDHESRGRK